MDRLDAIAAFVAVARTGGFSAGARSLGVPVANVSRKVALLEESLGVRLFVRTTRHVALTEGGRRYFEACSRLLDDLKDADEEVAGEYRAPQGDLVVTAPLGFGQQHLQPVVHEFLRAYPKVDVHLRLADRMLALVEEHVDCALRIAPLADSAFVARPLGAIRMMVCASPAWLRANGTPTHPSQLAALDCVSWTGRTPYRTWDFRLSPAEPPALQPVPIRVRLSTTTPESALQAALDGIGLVQATSYQVAPYVADGRLVPVLAAFEGARLPVSLVWPGQRLVPLKLRAFLDFVAPRLEQRLKDVEAVFDDTPRSGPQRPAPRRG
jgi:DNA-binding transcriptional LysR family regulator